MVVYWNRIWGWVFILLGCICFWAGLGMFFVGNEGWETLVSWSGVMPLFCAGMVWLMVSTEDN